MFFTKLIFVAAAIAVTATATPWPTPNPATATAWPTPNPTDTPWPATATPMYFPPSAVVVKVDMACDSDAPVNGDAPGALSVLVGGCESIATGHPMQTIGVEIDSANPPAEEASSGSWFFVTLHHENCDGTAVAKKHLECGKCTSIQTPDMMTNLSVSCPPPPAPMAPLAPESAPQAQPSPGGNSDAWKFILIGVIGSLFVAAVGIFVYFKMRTAPRRPAVDDFSQPLAKDGFHSTSGTGTEEEL
eukprot:TRINITY_DN20707_c0_g1_i1.p1 TRINITY_DN20707_c0_g1~~TRINITY_DN20707_c0_g1_i1.p1  ORF type:complete len:273 (+),score=37.14 TRINITY_DN20707_c0_g1_i1:87-821(+)